LELRVTFAEPLEPTTSVWNWMSGSLLFARSISTTCCEPGVKPITLTCAWRVPLELSLSVTVPCGIVCRVSCSPLDMEPEDVLLEVIEADAEADGMELEPPALGIESDWPLVGVASMPSVLPAESV